MIASQQQRGHAVVVGAGVVGLASALWLQRLGWRVTLLDRQPPGSGTSFGNACTFATYAVEPVATPGIWRQAPGMLLRRDSPLAIRPGYLPRIAPWLWRFLQSSSEPRVKAISHDLHSLLKPCMGAWQALFDDAGANDLVRHDGSLYIFEAHERQSAIDMLAYHQGFEVPMRLVQGPELRAMEPALNARAALALELPQVSRTLDPFALSQRLLRCFVERGGVFRRDELQGVERSAQDGERVLARLGSGEQLP
ncbi:MAG: FAD-dependent oxidoreductase, partial [Pseudomonas protegens]